MRRDSRIRDRTKSSRRMHVSIFDKNNSVKNFAQNGLANNIMQFYCVHWQKNISLGFYILFLSFSDGSDVGDNNE